MYKFGIELENFYIINNIPTIVPKEIPHDNEGFQVEFRGLPFSNIYESIGSVLANKKYIEDKYQIHNNLSNLPIITISRDIKLLARRTYSKGTLEYQNIYGYKQHSVNRNESTAGIHLSITKNKTIYTKKQTIETFEPWDFVQFFRYLDEEFKQEIKEAKRKPGFYEIKIDGRIEYRSLPCNISWDKLALVVSNYKF